jgi:hypothetical protein
MVLLSGTDNPTEIVLGEPGPLVTEKMGLEGRWACQVDDLDDVYLALFPRSIDLEWQNFLALAMREQERLTAYRVLKFLFASILYFFPERVTSRSSTLIGASIYAFDWLSRV